MKKVLGVVLAIIIAGSIVYLAIAQQSSQQLKNVQVLKYKSYAEVTKYMASDINPGLGVNCTFCHDTKDFSSDAKREKVISRIMLTMVQEVNKKYLTVPGKKIKQATCYMCHRGQKKPATSAAEENNRRR
ncbi:MAG: c-type cytochrome [bacterium]|nr:c-type cytochrome [bacterium]